MRLISFAFPLLAIVSATAFGQVTANPQIVNNARSVSNSSARDGFTRANGDTLFTWRGVTEKVTRDIVLRNGLRMSPDGRAVLPDGRRMWLSSNQILTLDGAVEDTPLTQAGVAPMPSGGSVTAGARLPAIGELVRDGITGTNTSAFITRGGVTQRVTSDVKLENGIQIQSNGTITLSNGTRVNLRPGQVLTFEGVLDESR